MWSSGPSSETQRRVTSRLDRGSNPGAEDGDGSTSHSGAPTVTRRSNSSRISRASVCAAEREPPRQHMQIASLPLLGKSQQSGPLAHSVPLP